MKIVITGGAGFVGSTLSLQLAQRHQDNRIIAFDNLKRAGSEYNISDLRDAGVEFVRGDIRCPEDLDALGDFDLMIECSAEPSVLAGLTSGHSYVVSNNLIGAIHCLDTCIKRNARVIFLSTSRVYPIDRLERAAFIEEPTRFTLAPEQSEAGISMHGVSESLDLTGARSLYGATKLAAELLIEEYVRFIGLRASVIRFGVIAGPRQMGKTDQGIASLWMAKHLWGGQLRYIGYGGMGKQVRDILHVDDVVDLIDLQLARPELFDGKVFNAGGGLRNSLSLVEMSRLCSEITGRKLEIGSEAADRPADLRSYVTDHRRITEQTGWSPSRDVKTVFTDLFSWMKQNEASLKPILS